MRAAAEVADVGLELVERGPHVVAEAHDGDRLHCHRTNDDVRLADRDVEGGEALLGQVPFTLQLRAPPLECGSQVAAADERSDLVERHPELAKGEDAAQLRQLSRRVVAVGARRIDPHRPEQAERVVGAQLLGADAGKASELADREHVETYLDFPSGGRSSICA